MQVQGKLLLQQQWVVVVLRAVVRPHLQQPVQELGEGPSLGHQRTPATLLVIQQHDALVAVLLFGA